MMNFQTLVKEIMKLFSCRFLENFNYNYENARAHVDDDAKDVSSVDPHCVIDIMTLEYSNPNILIDGDGYMSYEDFMKSIN